MNREDIIRMAKEAGIVVTGEAVWKLCEMVAAAERERIAKLFDGPVWAYDYRQIAALIRAGGSSGSLVGKAGG
jgi:hypothetical protein